jgi:hypothetical protein
LRTASNSHWCLMIELSGRTRPVVGRAWRAS